MKMVEYSLESIRKMLGKRDWLFFFFGRGGGLGDGEVEEGVWNSIRDQIR
jgi:hypothetical protein